LAIHALNRGFELLPQNLFFLLRILLRQGEQRRASKNCRESRSKQNSLEQENLQVEWIIRLGMEVSEHFSCKPTAVSLEDLRRSVLNEHRRNYFP